jgi:hypothetical protein
MLSVDATVGRDRERGVTGIGQSVIICVVDQTVSCGMLVLLYGTISTIA